MADFVKTPAIELLSHISASITSSLFLYLTPAHALENLTPSIEFSSGNPAFGAKGDILPISYPNYY